MFRKEVQISPSDLRINYAQQLITIGSCFSDSIGLRMETVRMGIMRNPFGTIFHPIALSNLVKGLKDGRVLERDQYFFDWQLGGRIFADSKAEMEQKKSTLRNDFQDQLKRADMVIVTFGTAWGYVEKETGEVVANCHKMPQKLFEKRLFSVNEIAAEWKSVLKAFEHVNWVFTVSPVRHWKDGVRENNVSKGILHQVIHELLEVENAHYFPAYEILLDELRDYRFYASDWLHPSKEAEDYIWKKFRATYFSEETDQMVNKVEQLLHARQHEVIHPNSVASKRFLAHLKEQEEEIEKLLKQAKS
ncbi:GSCFA domain-containing protein [Parvicella tangerina]|uniref:GSCFA domain-containing protein n=1 Tax=Parvicella tangerina TaxID=2829795 RepID=A0A916JLK7_9FLAO|nr:GSCFA domain-containing protein [Parvicella tangerina]CAG5079446.1 hypothetical protein CRYO30217_00947 [Parvicella tangerina]